MGVISTALRHMFKAGVKPEDIVAAVEEMEAETAPKRTARQDRNRRYYEKKASEKRLKASETSYSDESVLNKTPSRGGARVEDITSNLEIAGQKENKQEAAPLSDLQAFRAELSELDTERLDAIVKHRRSKKGQLTALSARLFVKDATACGLSLSEAVDACISRGWLTVKPEYFAGRKSSTAPPQPSKPRNAGEAARQELIRRGQYPNDASPSPRLVDTSDGNSGFAGTGIARRIALAASGGRTT